MSATAARTLARPRRVTGALIGLVCVLGTLWSPTAQAAPAAATLQVHLASAGLLTPAERPSLLGGDFAADQGISVSINDLDPRVLTTEGVLRVSGTLTNTSQEVLTNPLVIASVQAEAATNLSVVREYMSGQTWAGWTAQQVELPGEVAPGASMTFDLRVPTADLQLGELDQWGPRGITVEVHANDSSGSDRSLLLWDSGAQIPAVPAGVLVPVTEAGLESSTKLTSVVASIPTRESLLDLAATDGVTLAMDPGMITTTLDAESLAGTSAEAEASQSITVDLDEVPHATRVHFSFWESLLSSAEELVALPPHDADPGFAAAANTATVWSMYANSRSDLADRLDRLSRELSALRAAEAEAAGEDTESTGGGGNGTQSGADAAASANSANSAAGDTAASGSEDESTTVPAILTNVTWSPTSLDATLLRMASTDLLVATPGSLRPASDTSIGLARTQVDPALAAVSAPETGTTVLTSTQEIVSLLSWQPDSASDTLDSHQVLAALGLVAAREGTDPTTGAPLASLLVPLPRATSFDAALVERTRSLLDQRWIEASSLSELADSTADNAERSALAEVAGESTVASARLIATQVDRAGTLVAAVEDPEAAMDTLTDPTLAAMGTNLDDEARSLAVADLTSRVTTLMNGVSVESSVTVNLINKSANFPVQVRNDLDWPINVRVTLLPHDPRLRVVEPTEVTIPADATVTVGVPVTAIGSGDIEVTYRVTTSGGLLLSSSTTVLVRMRAGWEDAATLVISVLVGLAFLGGLVRTVRKRLRAAKDTDPEAAAAGTDSPEDMDLVDGAPSTADVPDTAGTAGTVGTPGAAGTADTDQKD